MAELIGYILVGLLYLFFVIVPIAIGACVALAILIVVGMALWRLVHPV